MMSMCLTSGKELESEKFIQLNLVRLFVDDRHNQIVAENLHIFNQTLSKQV